MEDEQYLTQSLELSAQSIIIIISPSKDFQGHSLVPTVSNDPDDLPPGEFQHLFGDTNGVTTKSFMVRPWNSDVKHTTAFLRPGQTVGVSES